MKRKYVVTAALAALVLVPLTVVHVVLRSSLPTLDGDVHHLGVVSPVTVDRDARGVPTIEAANRVDLAYGTGFVHGQDRFFEMDLSRRLAAGELSEVFGKVAVQQDERARLFRFRQVARAALQQATPEQRAVLEAYARGVNAGLAGLRSRPWEYWVLGSPPVEWRPEDTYLVSHAMWWDLQYSGIDREILRMQINERLHGDECEGGWKCALQFMYPQRTAWDAPNAAVGVVNSSAAAVGGAALGVAVAGADAGRSADDGGRAGDGSQAAGDGRGVPNAVSGYGAVDLPPPEVFDVRGAASAARAAGAPEASLAPPSPDVGIGSNNWAVSGRFTTTGAALVANDMHLRARVPIIWYRARLRVRASETQPALDLNGVTLPGTPILVAGSNGHIAWGFTNSYGDWVDVKKGDCSAANTEHPEEIRVHGGASVRFAVKSGPDGVLYRAEPDNKTCWFVSWLAQQPAATNVNLMGLERVSSVSEALTVAPTLGIPHQNFVVGDRGGHIAWTIAGRIPMDSGSSRSSGTPAWAAPELQPRIVDPEIGRIWTANSRATDDAGQLAAIGGVDASVGADYDLAARTRQIRDDLLALPGPAAPQDMLRIQLDDRALFLTRWQHYITALLDADAVANHPERAQFKRLVTDWNARASVDSVGYRLVRAFHERLERSVWTMMLDGLALKPTEESWAPSRFESALWVLVNERPMHMLAANYTDWRQFLLAEVDATIADLHQSCPRLETCAWGAHNPVHIQHSLSKALPFLSGLLDMPKLELPGDHDMPRVQDGPVGASERFAVSPGHEDQGYIHIPGGQSGHPLSPYYRAGFMDWAQGIPSPFLPGASQHRLTLQSE
ncbi:MAG: penicillin acylase family protein [Proteobacteria bacterium]|nr:penicillin acylase family protein [Pseudomonadota bacterium]